MHRKIQCSKFDISWKQFFGCNREFSTKFANRLCSTLHKLNKYKGFSYPKFSRIWTESKDIYREIYIRVNLYFGIYFIQCGIFHLLSKKLTHYWTRAIDIILLSQIFYILTIFNKKLTAFKNMLLWYSFNSLKYVHSWILVLLTILILKKSFQAFGFWPHTWAWLPW